MGQQIARFSYADRYCIAMLDTDAERGIGRIKPLLFKLNIQVVRNRLYDSLSARGIYGLEGFLCTKFARDYNPAGSAHSQRSGQFPL
jgi:hypothetical protein